MRVEESQGTLLVTQVQLTEVTVRKTADNQVRVRGARNLVIRGSPPTHGTGLEFCYFYVLGERQNSAVRKSSLLEPRCRWGWRVR